MPTTRRAAIKAKTALRLAPRLKLPPLTRDAFEQHFYGDVASNSSESDEDTVSDYDERPRAKRERTARMKLAKLRKAQNSMPRQPEPELPPMSETEMDDLDYENVPVFEKRLKPIERAVRISKMANIVRIYVPPGVSTINLDLGNLLHAPPYGIHGFPTNSTSDHDSPTLVEFQEVQRQLASSVSPMTTTRTASFLDLGPELRNKIYRLTLKSDSPVELNKGPANSFTAAVLRSNRLIQREAVGILYGENSFHLERLDKSRGQFWEKDWQEVGYKDVRRFLESIGPTNRACLRYVSLYLSDAAPYLTPKLDTQERRFVNDPVLLEVFRLLGSSGTVLDTLAVGFAGRHSVNLEDVHFLRAFCHMRCRRFIHADPSYGFSKINAHLLGKIQEVVEVPDGKVEQDKKRQCVRMKHEEGAVCSALKRFEW